MKSKIFITVFFINRKAAVMDFKDGIVQVCWGIFFGRAILFKYGGIGVTAGVRVDIEFWIFKLHPAHADFPDNQFEEIQRGIGSCCGNQVMMMLIPETIP